MRLLYYVCSITRPRFDYLNADGIVCARKSCFKYNSNAIKRVEIFQV